MAKNFLGTSTRKGDVDHRSPQEKGKPSHATAHGQAGGDPGGGTRKSAFHNITPPSKNVSFNW